MQTWKAWLAALAVLLVIFFGALGIKYVGDWVQPQSPKWIAVYSDSQCPDWCGRGYINGEQCDIVEGPYKSGYLFQIWYDNTVFWHYSEDYSLPQLAMFTNGDWTLLVDLVNFEGQVH